MPDLEKSEPDAVRPAVEEVPPSLPGFAARAIGSGYGVSAILGGDACSGTEARPGAA